MGRDSRRLFERGNALLRFDPEVRPRQKRESVTFGLGDLISILVALAFLAVGAINPFNRNRDRMVIVLANGLSFGTLILIVLSPPAQAVQLKPNLFEIAVKEGKVSLWWGAVVACFNLIGVLLEKAKPLPAADEAIAPVSE